MLLGAGQSGEASTKVAPMDQQQTDISTSRNEVVESLELLRSMQAQKKQNPSDNPNRDKCLRFNKAWINTALVTGVTEELMDILASCYVYADPDPLFKYLRKRDAKTPLKSIYATRTMQRNEAGIALKISTSLLAQELLQPTSPDDLVTITSMLPPEAKNAEDRIYGNLEQILKKYLVKPLTTKPMSEEALSVTADSRLAPIFGPALYSIGVNAKNTREQRAVSNLLKWLKYEVPSISSNHPAPQDLSATEPDKKTINLQPSSNHISSPTNSDNRSQESSQPNSSSDKTAVSSKPVQASSGHDSTANSRSLSQIIEMLQSLQAAWVQDRQAIASLERQLADSKAAYNNATALLDSQKNRAAELERGLVAVKSELADCHSKIQELEARAREAESHAKAQQEMIDLLDSTNKRGEDESKKRIMSKLHFEYKDFLDACDVPMSAELGENLRDQLNRIFEILKDGGYNL